MFLFQCALDTTYWTGFNHFVIWGSLVFYFAATFVFYSDPIDYYSYLGTARNVMSTANFWFTLILTVTVLLVPVVAERFYFIDTRPTLTDKVRLKQKISKSKSKTGELILRRASTMRRSTRSIGRSGYAFSHQEGFGQLITSGTNMRSRSDINSNRRTSPAGKVGAAGQKVMVGGQQKKTRPNLQVAVAAAAATDSPPPMPPTYKDAVNSSNNSNIKNTSQQQGSAQIDISLASSSMVSGGNSSASDLPSTIRANKTEGVDNGGAAVDDSPHNVTSTSSNMQHSMDYESDATLITEL